MNVYREITAVIVWPLAQILSVPSHVNAMLDTAVTALLVMVWNVHLRFQILFINYNINKS